MIIEYEQDYALVIPDRGGVSETARILLGRARDSGEVKTVRESSGVAFRVPLYVVKGLVDSDDSAAVPDPVDNGSVGDSSPVVPRGNASRDEWLVFLREQGVSVSEDATRNEMREAWLAST